MATAQTATTPKAKLGRRKMKKIGRDKKKLKLHADKEYATKFFEAKSKRASDKKVAFRKKKSAK